jgi:FkbM family methyltransferase
MGEYELSAIKVVLKRLISPEMRGRIKHILRRESFDEVELLYKLLRDSGVARVMVDVGAHHGGSLERFARDGWQVYAFEPDVQNRSLLERLCRVYPSVSIDSRAVADVSEAGRAFFSSEVSSGISGLSSFHPSHRESGRVDTVTLSEYCEKQGIKKIGFLKIDTEGYDLFVPKGVPWESVRPQVILCEFEDRKTVPLGYSFHDIAGFLAEKGYHLLISEWYPVVEYGRQHRWRRFATFPCELADVAGWGNIIAVEDPALYSKLCAFVQK